MQHGPELQLADSKQEYTLGEYTEHAQDGIFRPDINATDTIYLGEDISFVYVMRKDNRGVVEPIAGRLASETGLDIMEVRSILHEEYETFFAELADTILDSVQDRRNINNGAVQLHVFDAEGIEKKALDRCQGAVISADPLKVDVEGINMMHVSREYLMGGRKSIGLRNRPGSPPIADQVASIKENIGVEAVTATDDDSYTGSTMAQLISILKNGGVWVDNVVFDIQMGKPVKLSGGIRTDAAMTYLTENGEDITQLSDLGDPRDFLVGASGLVVKMANGEPGRVPYVMPFVSPHARMGIPEEQEYAFSDKVLQMNFRFFSRVADRLGHDLTLKHMDEYFAAFMKDTYGFDLDTPLSTVVAWAGEHMQEKRADIEDIGRLQEKLHILKLPQTIVMLDTADHSDQTELNATETARIIMKYSALLEKHGIVFGLSTNGLLPDLEAYAAKIGLENCPFLSKNGRELSYNNMYFYPGPNSEFTDHTTEYTLELLGSLGHTIALVQVSGESSSVEQLDRQLAELCETLEAN
jgi:hypothetical protein